MENPVGLVARLGVRSIRVVDQFLKHWRQKLTGHQYFLLADFCAGAMLPNCTNPYPAIGLFLDCRNCSGPYFESVNPVGASLEAASGKALYKIMVKTEPK